MFYISFIINSMETEVKPNPTLYSSLRLVPTFNATETNPGTNTIHINNEYWRKNGLLINYLGKEARPRHDGGGGLQNTI